MSLLSSSRRRILMHFGLLACTALAQNTSKLSPEKQTSLKNLGVELAAAQKAEDEAEVFRLAEKAIEVPGEHV